ncbi:hypothetical protein AK812_SmicGene20447 [Symbiodinium microadriaticum]|uniref:Uncharacterized protein n=1 Tax=Symbiodinium microadriaticum TaxID=2951 RepID=A0A1Q9DPW3_SYMMI|nr:hypothetical protein AK812_SmicGene20447 [Symbiodinium microadriaticum]
MAPASQDCAIIHHSARLIVTMIFYLHCQQDCKDCDYDVFMPIAISPSGCWSGIGLSLDLDFMPTDSEHLHQTVKFTSINSVPPLRSDQQWRYLDYGAEERMKWFAFAETVMQVFFSEVVINGKPGSVLNCEEAVLQVAEGSIDGLGFAEVRHEVSFPAAKKLDTGKAKLHRSPAQAIGCMTGCDLILDEAQSQMLVVGPSEAVARGAARSRLMWIQEGVERTPKREHGSHRQKRWLHDQPRGFMGFRFCEAFCAVSQRLGPTFDPAGTSVDSAHRVPDYEAAEDFLELPAGGGAENQAEDRNDDDVEADAEPGELVYNEEEEDVFITEGAEGTQTHPETFVEEGDPGRSSQTDQQDMSDEVLVDLDPIPDDGQAHLSSNGKQRRNLDAVPLQYARFWEQDMSMEFDLANKDDTFEGDVFEQEDLDDFADEEAIKHELLSEIQTLRERQEEGVHPEGDIVWQVDEEELHDMEHEQAEPGDGRTKAKVIRPPMQPKSKHKAKPTPPSEPPPNWHNGAESSQADLHDDAGTQWTPWRSQKAGGKRQQAKGTWTEQKTKRKVEYAGNSPPALRRKSWSTDNWAGHEGRGSEWGDSSWDGPSHQRGYRHAKPMDKDWSRDWKAWKDESTWQRGWSWKRR